MLGVLQQLLDGREDAFFQDGVVDEFPGELDGDDVVGLVLGLPGMRKRRTRHHQIDGAEGLFGISHHARSRAVHDQVDLEFRVIMHRIIELGVRMVEDDKKILFVEGDDFL